MATPTGKNPSVVNLESMASAMQNPKTAPCLFVGSSTQISIVRKAAPRQAASPMSVVARPACARMVGIMREQTDCDDTGGGSEVAPRPPEDHQAPEHKERQVAEAHQGDRLFRMMLVGDQVPAFQLKMRFAARARAREVGQDRDHGARQRRMLRFVPVDVLSHILQAAGDVGRFVAGRCEDVVGGDDAADPEQEEASHQHTGMLREKRFDAGFPNAGWGGRCFGRLD